ncbi:MAG: OsmC family protein [Bacteroidetes bacterium]|jgi:putative redox protein|nr:MAG: OsmC family protein [Bacteroidota bacterium]
MKTSTKWKHDGVFESHQEGSDKSITIDTDRKQGPGPKSLLLSGLAGCSGIDVIDILKKQRVEFSDFSIDVESETTTDHPKVFRDISVTYSIRTDPANEKKVKKAIELSLDKYCGVSAMLKKNSGIHYKLQLIK